MRKIVFKNKKGSELAISQMIAFILAGLLIVLIIYGLISGQLQPLIKKVGIFFDAVLVQLKIKKVEIPSNSQAVNIPGVGDGTLVFDADNFQCDLTLDDGSKYKWDYEKGELNSYERYVQVSDGNTELFRVGLFYGRWYIFSGGSWIDIYSYDPQNSRSDLMTLQTLFSSGGAKYLHEMFKPPVNGGLKDLISASDFLIELYKKQQSVSVQLKEDLFNGQLYLSIRQSRFIIFETNQLIPIAVPNSNFNEVKTFLDKKCT